MRNDVKVNGDPLFVVKTAVRRFLRREPKDKRDFEAAGKRLGGYSRKKPYDAYYIKSAYEGRCDPISGPLLEAAEALIAELDGDLSGTKSLRTVLMKVPHDVNVAPGSIILKDSITCICGANYIPGQANQEHHQEACKRLARKIRDQARRQK